MRVPCTDPSRDISNFTTKPTRVSQQLLTLYKPNPTVNPYQPINHQIYNGITRNKWQQISCPFNHHSSSEHHPRATISRMHPARAGGPRSSAGHPNLTTLTPQTLIKWRQIIKKNSPINLVTIRNQMLIRKVLNLGFLLRTSLMKRRGSFGFWWWRRIRFMMPCITLRSRLGLLRISPIDLTCDYWWLWFLKCYFIWIKIICK